MPSIAIIEDLAPTAATLRALVSKHVPRSVVEIYGTLDDLFSTDACRLPAVLAPLVPNFAEACMICDICMVHRDFKNRQGLHYLRRLNETAGLKELMPRVVVYSALVGHAEFRELVTDCGIPEDNIVLKQSGGETLRSVLRRLWKNWV